MRAQVLRGQPGRAATHGPRAAPWCGVATRWRFERPLSLCALALIAGALTACGGRFGDFVPAGTCGDGIWIEDAERNCECLRAQLRMSRSLLHERGGIEPTWFDGVKVYVSARADSLAEGSDVTGVTWSSDELVTERWMRPLTHELLHIYELRRGVSWRDATNHTFWAEPGWFALADEGWERTLLCIP